MRLFTRLDYEQQDHILEAVQLLLDGYTDSDDPEMRACAANFISMLDLIRNDPGQKPETAETVLSSAIEFLNSGRTALDS
jgi:uncharacterized protein (UPF0147 family)